MNDYYYLHENGDLIYKKYIDKYQVEDFQESDMVKYYWEFDGGRLDAWFIFIEALALGGNPKKIYEIAERGGYNNEDAKIFAEKTGFKINNDFKRFNVFYNQYSSVGISNNSYLEAFANFWYKNGFRGDKKNPVSFLEGLKNIKEVGVGTREGL